MAMKNGLLSTDNCPQKWEVSYRPYLVSLCHKRRLVDTLLTTGTNNMPQNT